MILLAMLELLHQAFAFSVADLPLPEWARVVAAIPTLWALMLTNGLEHAIAYNASTGGPSFEALNVGLHEVDVLQEWAYYLLAALAGVPFLAIFGASFVARMLFQGPINLTTTGTLFGEGAYFSVRGVRIPKLFRGKAGRVEQMTLGLIFLAASLTAYFQTV